MLFILNLASIMLAFWLTAEPQANPPMSRTMPDKALNGHYYIAKSVNHKLASYASGFTFVNIISCKK